MAQEMNPFDEQIGRENQRLPASDGQHGAVVADALEPVVGNPGEKLLDVCDKSEFGHGSVV